MKMTLTDGAAAEITLSPDSHGTGGLEALTVTLADGATVSMWSDGTVHIANVPQVTGSDVAETTIKWVAKKVLKKRNSA